jgi:phytoene dehydrogenase-like protein
MIQPTNIDPDLAPKGHHLVMAHQAVQGIDLHRELELGLKDIRELFPSVDYEVLAVQCYAGDWPVNRVASGHDAGPNTPIRGLKVVGDGAKVHGGVEVEGVAMGVAEALAGEGIEHGVEL